MDGGPGVAWEGAPRPPRDGLCTPAVLCVCVSVCVCALSRVVITNMLWSVGKGVGPETGQLGGDLKPEGP